MSRGKASRVKKNDLNDLNDRNIDYAEQKFVADRVAACAGASCDRRIPAPRAALRQLPADGAPGGQPGRPSHCRAGELPSSGMVFEHLIQ